MVTVRLIGTEDGLRPTHQTFLTEIQVSSGTLTLRNLKRRGLKEATVRNVSKFLKVLDSEVDLNE
jgi:hypothetical protein